MVEPMEEYALNGTLLRGWLSPNYAASYFEIVCGTQWFHVRTSNVLTLPPRRTYPHIPGLYLDFPLAGRRLGLMFL